MTRPHNSKSTARAFEKLLPYKSPRHRGFELRETEFCPARDMSDGYPALFRGQEEIRAKFTKTIGTQTKILDVNKRIKISEEFNIPTWLLMMPHGITLATNTVIGIPYNTLRDAHIIGAIQALNVISEIHPQILSRAVIIANLLNYEHEMPLLIKIVDEVYQDLENIPDIPDEETEIFRRNLFSLLHPRRAADFAGAYYDIVNITMPGQAIQYTLTAIRNMAGLAEVFHNADEWERTLR